MAGSERPFFFSLRSNNTSQQQHTHREPIYAAGGERTFSFGAEGLISILLRPVLVRNYQQARPSYAQGLLRRLFK